MGDSSWFYKIYKILQNFLILQKLQNFTKFPEFKKLQGYVYIMYVTLPVCSAETECGSKGKKIIQALPGDELINWLESFVWNYLNRVLVTFSITDAEREREGENK